MVERRLDHRCAPTRANSLAPIVRSSRFSSRDLSRSLAPLRAAHHVIVEHSCQLPAAYSYSVLQSHSDAGSSKDQRATARPVVFSRGRRAACARPVPRRFVRCKV